MQLPPEEALETLSRPDAYASSDTNILLLHAELAYAKGEFDLAKVLLTPLLDDAAGGSVARARLASIAILTGELKIASALMAENAAARPTRRDQETPGLLARLTHDPATEIKTLRAVPAESLSPWEVGRLGTLLIAAEKTEDALALFRQLSLSGAAAAQARQRLIVALIDEHDGRGALQAAADWYVADGNDFATVEILLPLFLSRGAVVEARWLADFAMERSHAQSHRLALIFLRAGHRDIALNLQRAMLSQEGGLSVDEWRTLVRITELTGDVRSLHTALAAPDHSKLAEPILADALLQILRYHGTLGLVPHRARLTKRLAEHAPLIAAAFAIEQSRFSDVVTYLVAAADTGLGEWDQTIWISIAERLRGTEYEHQLAASVLASDRLAAAARDIASTVSR